MNPVNLKRSSSAFILLEAIASLSILSMIAAGITTGAIAILEIGHYVADVGAAYDRADQVFSMLKRPADLCGYGMPGSAALYREAFANVSDKAPFSWDGAISIADTEISKGVYRKNGTCRIVYCLASGAHVMKDTTASADKFQLTAYGKGTILEWIEPASEKPTLLKNWVLFGSSLPLQHPMWISDKIEGYTSIKKLTLNWNKPASADGSINFHRNDGLYYICAIECQVSAFGGDAIFYVKDFRGGGRQPKENGIIDARFRMDEGRKMLYVALLVRGDRRYEGIKTAGTPSGWPEEYAPDIPESARRYRLFAFAESYELKNL
ncbi:MAG: hypothetical protein LBG29_02775 [Synergistaceae bacterium]|jgi:hypothetical protein|nr:hypothetical protein [Synergistaceae bacterium]